MREYKGENLVELPSNFTVIDLETTGLYPEWDEIIEVAAIKCRNYNVVDVYSALVKPEDPIDDFISELTGITNDMLENAKDISAVLPGFIKFIGDDIVIAHNANFDINFLYDKRKENFGEPFSNNFVDTMRISRLLHRGEKHHRLKDLCARYEIVRDEEHRALSDCYACLECYCRIRNEIKSNYSSIDEIRPVHKHLRASEITPTEFKQDELNPLYGKVCVFTGTLERMLRKEAMQIVVNIGGIVADSVTKKTNFLILGNSDYCSSIKDGKSTKQKKAEKLKLAGHDIEIIPESVFYSMITEQD